MAEQIKTKLMNSEQDLDSLVVGDRVKINIQDLSDDYFAVYEGNFDGKFSFVLQYLGKNKISSFSAEKNNIGFGWFGNIETNYYWDEKNNLPGSKDYNSKLALLKQTKLWKDGILL